MHFSHAFIAVLSLSASQAIAAPVQQGSNGLIARGDASKFERSLDAMVERSSLSSQEAQESRHIFARYAHISNDRERTVAVVRDLSKRGILDTLVSAISQILNELLGTASSTSMSRRQTGPIITYTTDLISSAVCLLESLLGVSASGCSAPAGRRDLSGKMSQFDTSSAAATQTSLAQMLTMIGKILEEKGDSLSSNSTSAAAASTNATTAAANTTAAAHGVKGAASNATSTALPATKGAKESKNKTTDKRDLLTRQETEGVQGLLEVVRELVDAILNTLLPMSSRSESSATSSAKGWPSPTGKNCPPPGTPNDGMYRPGCPGYGRRDLGSVPTLSTRDASMLQSMLPMLQMLLEELPSLLSGDSSSSTGSNSLSSLLSGNASTSSSTDSAAVTSAAGAAADGIPTSAVTAKKPKATGTKNAPISAAKLSIDTRSLLEADGFQRRQAAATGTDDNGDNNGGSSQSGNTGGANVSILNNLLNGLLGNLLGGGGGGLKTADLGDNNNGTSQNGNTGGLNVSILDNLLNGLLGGLLGTSSRRDVSGNKGGINVELLNGLLNNVLSNKHMKRAAVTYATRSLLNARADFQPVWDEVKKLGDGHFHSRSFNEVEGDHDLIARNDLAPVWSSFRDMVDSAYAQQKSQGHQRRSPQPTVDTSAFSHATAQFLKQKVFGKRDADLQPLKNAVTNFAKSQMGEWTEKLNAKSH